MARNEEKSQSMLFRFRESKAIELGMINRSDRRPRIASLCTDLRQAERWRGEILREISRKVAKIQDNSLTDFEVRDLNDEINHSMREKWHWENQIINLGGANYRRAAPKITMDDGTEVPGMKGYKYFGRAKELPGVKELLKQQEDEIREQYNLKHQKASIYSNQTPEYYGNLADEDQELADFERAAELEGKTAWEAQWDNVKALLDLPEEADAPACPKAEWISLSIQEPPALSTDDDAATGAKRKAIDDTDESNKRSKNQDGAAGHRILTVLDLEDLRPQVPSKAEVERAILQRQKAELLQEYVR